MVPLERVRQFDAKCVSENGNDDPVEKQQNRSDNADAHDNADNQSERNCNDRKGILVGHRATMQPFARGRQGRLSLKMRRRSGLTPHPMPLQRASDLVQNRRVVDGGRHSPRVAIGDLLDGAAQDFA
jgi:hypothetical protein